MEPSWLDSTTESVGATLANLLRASARVATRDIPVLVTGETGVGKEVFVRRFHELTGRAGPLQAVNCAALPQELAETLLFGHEKGSFTSASAASTGLIARANHGTLFLDEIGELHARGQAVLLRFLQEGRLLPIGSSSERAVDVRIVAATNRDLERMVDMGTFRADLFYRLNGVVFNIPPLRERPSEIIALAEHFVQRAGREWALEGLSLTAAALDRLQDYAWPGNIRELRHVVRSTVAQLESRAIEVDDLPRHLCPRLQPRQRERSDLPAKAPTMIGSASLRELVQDYERTIITGSLRRCGGNITLAARLLKVPVRTLSYKIRAHAVQHPADRKTSDTTSDSVTEH